MPNCLNYFVTFMVYTQFIYVAVGRGFETRGLHAALTRRRKGRSLRTFRSTMAI